MLACYLRALRGEQQLPREAVSAAVGVEEHSLTRVEAWLDEPTWPLVEKLLDVYGINDRAVIGGIRFLVHGTHPEPGIVHDAAPGWEVRLAAVLAASGQVRAVGAGTFPAVLWSPRFAETMASAQRLHPVKRRGLPDGHRASITAVVHETALLQPHGGPGALADQISHTIGLIRNERAEVLITPLAAGLALPPITEICVGDHAMTIVDNGWTGTCYVTAPEVRDEYAAQFEAVKRGSLSTGRSMSHLIHALAYYTGGSHGPIPLLRANTEDR